MLTRSTPATRRTALGLGVAGITAATASACTSDGPSGGPSGGSRSTGPGTPTAPPAAGDELLVEEVVARIGATAALVGGALDGFPGLVPQRRALARLHAAHLAALDASPTEGGAPAPAPRTRAEALRLVRRRESALQRFLVGASVAAESGALARLLASMSAAVAQRLAVLG